MSEATVTAETVVSELVETAFEGVESVTAYKIAIIINGSFEVLGVEKVIPTQMMYNYSRNGLINKIKGSKQFNKEEVTTFVTKYVNKYVK